MLGLYRLPWTASDNAMTWLEPTRRCNITCDACFAENDPRSEKSLDQIRQELQAMMSMRRCDAVLVAGGEPLTHPRVDDVVRMVRDAGAKPVVVTNGVLLDRSTLRRLARAGAHGFTVHVDAHQARPGWHGATESELNTLRTTFAEMLREEGGLTCGFNVTIFPDTLTEVPAIVRWAVDHPDLVHVLTLICVRTVDPSGPFAYYAGGLPVDLRDTPYVSAEPLARLMTADIAAEVAKVLPGFRFSAYLGGTVNPLSPKWVVGNVLSSRRRTYGFAGPRTMETVQAFSHVTRGRYLAYTQPRLNRMGKATLLLGLLDPELRRTAGRWLAGLLRDPGELFRELHIQSISVVQPVDILPNGEMDTCDGCPNRTYWNGRMVSACRLDEYRRYGAPVHAAPRSAPGRPQ
jgi:hypothetical protein